ncbi:MAG: hypothetical protein U9Q90_07110 [Campylobacterota bacterium]|nr:hypothetical protein [Campylobacterota bacterium]
MRRSILPLSAVTLLVLSGCGASGLTVYDIDPELPRITEIRSLSAMSSIGFEWDKIRESKVRGVNIYREVADKGKTEFKRVGTVGNRYGTHFVDTYLKPDQSYRYTFKTYRLGKESERGTVVTVKTLPPFPPVSFAKAYQEDKNVVKILWRPHTNPKINGYVIERSANGQPFKYLAQIDGRLMAEYIDSFARKGYRYRYRIIAKSYDKIKAEPSEAAEITIE